MKQLLEGLGIPVAYDHFKKKTNPPFILFRNTDATAFKADDKVLWIDNNYIIDLITDIKDPDLEKELQSIFDSNDLPYDKEEDFIDNEQIYQITYFI